MSDDMRRNDINRIITWPAMTLDTNELNAFLDLYCQKNENPNFNTPELLKDGIRYETAYFIKSAYAGMPAHKAQEDKHVFHIYEIRPDGLMRKCVGSQMIPYVNPKNNIRIKKEPPFHDDATPPETKYYKNLILYVIFSDFDIGAAGALKHKPYNGYRGLLQEFKDKCSRYLPTDFNYNTHVGSFSTVVMNERTELP